MSKYEDRVKEQSVENRQIYYEWIDEFNRLGKRSLKTYKSTVTEFLEFNGGISILDIKIETIKKFLEKKLYKPNTKQNKLLYLKDILEFVSRKYKTRWNFTVDDLKNLLLTRDEIRESTISAEPLSAKQLIKLYNFFNEHIKEGKWLVVYTIFRLMYNYDLDKFDIAKINSETYDLQKGEFIKDRFSSTIIFDEEIVSIFKKNGSDFLPNNDSSVYDRLRNIEEVLDVNITQEVIKTTRELLTIRCPHCGKFIENDVSLFGYVQTDLLNLGTLIVCKKCLENEL